ncbi:hypothetical protein L484_027738 [Morus notabilis]|uniref:Uncharacterized protein n=1 Tax=Morus notabilis TaxID=981085 RepID=W9RN71_9ROSA|nr:hypothetical protein L484_027738 [Morus notabilis]
MLFYCLSNSEDSGIQTSLVENDSMNAVRAVSNNQGFAAEYTFIMDIEILMS